MTHEPKKADTADEESGGLHRRNVQTQSKEKPRFTPKPLNGHDHWKELKDAVSEKDIIGLRLQLMAILSGKPGEGLDHHPVFDTSETLDIDDFLSRWNNVNPEEITAVDALPKIHIHQHHRASGEQVHHFYEEQFHKLKTKENDEAEHDPEWLLMEEALKERDVVDLRESLRQIGSLVPMHGISAEEIEQFNDGKWNRTARTAFLKEMELNKELEQDVRLEKELREAVVETEIMDLREKLHQIMQTQHSTARSVGEIEAFLDDSIDPASREAFISELSENDDLKAEISLIKSLDKAFTEHDISALRKKLEQLSGNLEQHQVNSLFSPGIRNSKRAGMFAAVFLFLAGLSTVMWLFRVEDRRDYSDYFVVPEAVNVVRSAPDASEVHLFTGLELFNKADYTSALASFRKMPEDGNKEPIAHFYAGASCQNLHMYKEALSYYQWVITQGDNLFVEQAEWLGVFCMLQISENHNAVKQLEAIIEKKGFYMKDAILLLPVLKEHDD